jgi:protein-disulfide isomerase/uncharacterized membrane protein
MKKTFFGLLIATLLGIIASILMTQLHYQIGGVGFEEKSFCHVSDFLDCDTALASRYSQFNTPAGVILTSELGIIYYFLIAFGLAYAWSSSQSSLRRSTLAFLFTSSLFAFAYSVVMGYLSIIKLGVLCLLCLTSYLANLFLLILFPKALQIRYRDVPLFLGRYLKSLFNGGLEMKPRLVFHLSVTVLFIGVGLVFFRGLNPQIHKAHAEIPREAYLKIFYASPHQEIPLPDRPLWGNQDGRVTVVEFSDFQCPFCRVAAFSLKPYLKEFRKDVRLIFMNYPLDSSCNPAVAQGMHSSACLAAKAAFCAHQKGKFWDYHDRLFENQKRLSRETFLRIAEDLDLDRSSFEQCLVSDEVGNLLKEDIELGSKLEVRGTPSVYINGRSFRDWMNPERLRMVLESEIKRVP